MAHRHHKYGARQGTDAERVEDRVVAGNGDLALDEKGHHKEQKQHEDGAEADVANGFACVRKSSLVRLAGRKNEMQCFRVKWTGFYLRICI